MTTENSNCWALLSLSFITLITVFEALLIIKLLYMNIKKNRAVIFYE